MSITLGVSNWQDFAADGGYYPDDLPQDWKLSYFANEFSSACLNLSAETLPPGQYLVQFSLKGQVVLMKRFVVYRN